MMPSEAQKRANKKYKAKTESSVACRIKKPEYERFKLYCATLGKTPNAVLREYIYKCIEGIPEPEETEKAGGI